MISNKNKNDSKVIDFVKYIYNKNIISNILYFINLFLSLVDFVTL